MDIRNRFKFDVVDSELDGENSWAGVAVWLPEDESRCVHIDCGVLFDKYALDVTWEPDSDPTYVDYGSQSVLYDDGKGGVESVDASSAVERTGENIFLTEDGEEIDQVKSCEILGCTEEELKEIISVAEGMAEAEIIRYAQNHYSDPDYWSEIPSPEPDFDPYDWM